MANKAVFPPSPIANPPVDGHVTTLRVDSHSTLLGDFIRGQQTITEAVLESGIDPTLGEDVLVTLTANRTMALPLSGVAGQRLHLIVTMGGAGGYTLSFVGGIANAGWVPNPAVGGKAEAYLTCLGPNSWLLGTNNTNATDATAVHLAGTETITGVKTIAARLNQQKDLVRTQQTVTEAVLVSGVDATAGEDVLVTLTANRVMGLPLNAVAGQRLHLIVTEGGAGGFALTFNAGITVKNFALNMAAGDKTEATLTCLSPSTWLLASNPASGPLGSASNIKIGPSWVNVQMEGADMSGATAMDAPWASAIGKLPATAGGIFVGPGTPSLASPQGVPAAMSLAVKGAGKGITTITGKPTVSGSGNRGLIQMIAGTLYTSIDMSDFSVDLTAVTDTAVSAIYQKTAAIQRCSWQRIALDLSGGGVHHGGLFFEGLGGQALTPSEDLTFRDIDGHNGNGSILLYLNAAAATSLARRVLIDHPTDRVDAQNIGDDRWLIAANNPGGGGVAEFRDVNVHDATVEIASTVTSGLVNGLKFDTGANSYIHRLSTARLKYMNKGAQAVAGNAVAMLLGGGSYLQDYAFDDVQAEGASAAIIARFARREANPFISMNRVKLFNGWVATAGIEIYASTAPSGDELVTMREIALHNQASLGAVLPIAVMWTGGPTAGCSGRVLVSGYAFQGFKTGFSNQRSEAGGQVTTGWSNIEIDDGWPSATTNFDMINIWRHTRQNGAGGGAVGMPGFPASATPLTNTTGADLTVYISTGAGVTVSAVAIGGSTLPGVTLAQNSSSTPIRWLANSSITVTYAGGTPTWAGFTDIVS